MGEKKSGRGFAGMDPEKQREISRKGGEASHGGGKSAKSPSSATSRGVSSTTDKKGR